MIIPAPTNPAASTAMLRHPVIPCRFSLLSRTAPGGMSTPPGAAIDAGQVLPGGRLSGTDEADERPRIRVVAEIVHIDVGAFGALERDLVVGEVLRQRSRQRHLAPVADRRGKPHVAE